MSSEIKKRLTIEGGRSECHLCKGHGWLTKHSYCGSGSREAHVYCWECAEAYEQEA